LRDLPITTDWLHSSEKEVLSGFRFIKKRKDWLLGRWTAKNAVKYFLRDTHQDLSFQSIEVVAAVDGAPEVYCNEHHLPAHISLSHSDGTGFCTVSSPEIKIGCDLEKIEPRSESLIKDHFTDHEQKLILTSDKAFQALWENLIWSAKESALKALRKGLRIDTLMINVDFSPAVNRESWNKLKATFLDGGIVFQGYWQFSTEFVMTILCNQQDIEPIEIHLAKKNIHR